VIPPAWPTATRINLNQGRRPVRQIFLDTETTGLEHKFGHRIIEIAGVEMRNRRLTQRHFHRYLNPEREIDAGALSVHGISRDFCSTNRALPTSPPSFSISSVAPNW
jgi:DNA polymerase III epsilon subunit-like protein